MDGPTLALLITAIGGMATGVAALVKARNSTRVDGRTVAVEEVDSALKVLGVTIDRQNEQIARQQAELAHQQAEITRLQQDNQALRQLVQHMEKQIEELLHRRYE